MGNKKDKAKDFFPLMAGWGESKDDRKKQWKEFKSGMEKLWDQYEDMKKAAKKAKKKQWEQFFSQCMEMQQTVADALPDEKVSLLGMPAASVSPKEFVEKAKEFQEKANTRAMEQADNLFELRMQRRQQMKEMVSDAVQNVEDNLDAVESSKDDEPAEK